MIELRIDDGVAEVVLNAPERLNALDEDALHELSAAYGRAAEAGVRALVLRGEGRAFCAGRDISTVDPVTDDVPHYLGDVLTPLLRRMSAFPAPTFAAARGACLGVGLGLLIATDVVYVADDARVGSPFAALGAMLDSGGHALFYERLGAHRTLDLVYTGRLLSGAEAVAAGLFSRAFPADEVEDAAMDAARSAATGATAAFLASKALVARLRDERLGLWDAVAAENAGQAALSATVDYREGFAAFQRRRAPSFQGR
ncbi:enoyl-CoA hydratase/isomerase family protein [Microbacterium sp.]|uniref:enoyl-CoA hydratase/isomerase family protein n=1 Tax=Microbacterium sp. TaxID=51671 RepID=UPI000928C931|nr:enoyl-CoA hydratase/isomerase family protein [Microbacterium sp.]MBN9192673.1 enoyl-CoA hydratase/isomerase family protein [Microbacterium sp.]OJU66770.1 MAG: crotonase [Microbacterium sp. 70-38]